MRILSQLENLLLGQTRETEHANLIGDMVPTSLFPIELLKPPPQRPAHLLDAPTHGPQVLFPFKEQSRIIEDSASNAGAVRRRVADFGSLQDRELGADAADRGSCIWAGTGDKVEGATTFAIEAKVFGKGLCDAKFEALRDEVADGPGVVFEITRCETLVGAVEKGEVLPRTYGLGEFDPLGLGEVDAGRVMGAGMQQDDTTLRGLSDGGMHAGEVETFGMGMEVRVRFYRNVDVGEYLIMISPCWGGEIDGLIQGAREEFGEEESA